MSNDDLVVFNQAVQEATANPSKVYEILKELVSRNRNDLNLLSWLVFTAPDYTSKEKWLNHAKIVAPQNETVMQAEQWFNQQPKPTMPIHPAPLVSPHHAYPQQTTILQPPAQHIPAARPNTLLNTKTLTKTNFWGKYKAFILASIVVVAGLVVFGVFSRLTGTTIGQVTNSTTYQTGAAKKFTYEDWSNSLYDMWEAKAGTVFIGDRVAFNTDLRDSTSRPLNGGLAHYIEAKKQPTSKDSKSVILFFEDKSIVPRMYQATYYGKISATSASSGYIVITVEDVLG